MLDKKKAIIAAILAYACMALVNVSAYGVRFEYWSVMTTGMFVVSFLVSMVVWACVYLLLVIKERRNRPWPIE